MPLGMEVGLGPGDTVLDGDPVPQKTGAQPPINFQPMSIVAKRTDVDLSPDDNVCKTGTSPSPPKKKWTRPHNFWPMCIVTKQSPISATAELLLSEYN